MGVSPRGASLEIQGIHAGKVVYPHQAIDGDVDAPGTLQGRHWKHLVASGQGPCFTSWAPGVHRTARKDNKGSRDDGVGR